MMLWCSDDALELTISLTTLATFDVQWRYLLSPDFGTKFHGGITLIFGSIPNFLKKTLSKYVEGSFCAKNSAWPRSV